MTMQALKQPETAIKQIPFIDLKAQQDRIRPQIDAAIKQVLDHGQYIMGPEVFELEKQCREVGGWKQAAMCG